MKSSITLQHLEDDFSLKAVFSFIFLDNSIRVYKILWSQVDDMMSQHSTKVPQD